MKKILARLGMALLALGMLLYLGKHSLAFFQFTFHGEDEIYAWLGLLTTSAGVLIWLADFLWLAETDLQKTTAFVMVFVSLLGEFGVAGFDIYLNASGMLEGGAQFTDTDVRNMSLVVAGLALIHGLALVVDVAGDAVRDAWNDNKPTKQKVAPSASDVLPVPGWPLLEDREKQKQGEGRSAAGFLSRLLNGWDADGRKYQSAVRFVESPSGQGEAKPTHAAGGAGRKNGDKKSTV